MLIGNLILNFNHTNFVINNFMVFIINFSTQNLKDLAHFEKANQNILILDWNQNNITCVVLFWFKSKQIYVTVNLSYQLSSKPF